MVVLLAAMCVGGMASFALLWPYDVLTALCGAELGATLPVFILGLSLAWQAASSTRSQKRYFRAQLKALRHSGWTMSILDPLTGRLIEIQTSVAPQG
jgi:hypothetical protein